MKTIHPGLPGTGPALEDTRTLALRFVTWQTSTSRFGATACAHPGHCSLWLSPILPPTGTSTFPSSNAFPRKVCTESQKAVDWTGEYCRSVLAARSNLPTQCGPYKVPRTFSIEIVRTVLVRQVREVGHDA